MKKEKKMDKEKIKNELTVKEGEMVISETAVQYLAYANRLQEQIDLAKSELEEIKEAFKQAMAENCVKQFKNDIVTISYVGSSVKKTVDTAKMKEDGIYDKYTKETVSKPSVRFAFVKKPDEESLPF